jgi:dihydrofolate synthase/folylpolyglutamate synthase
MPDRYHASIAWLASTIPLARADYMASRQDGMEFFLERTRRWCAALGNPQDQFQTIHIAGTSGKGSVSTMVANILHAAGWPVGLYLSPHVSTALERVQAFGRLVEPDQFAAAVDRVRPVFERVVREDGPWTPSYAEVFFGAALFALQDAGCEWLVLETGCGGRYDKTNVIKPPAVAVITNIGYDHCELLGDTLPEIAHHKAGIIKPGTAVFSAERDPAVQAVLEREAAVVGNTIRFILPAERFETAMPGEHQQWNAALAAAAARHLGIGEPAIRTGIRATRLPARTELVQDQPRVLLDGAHSPPKIAALAALLPQYRPWNRLHLIFAAKETNDLPALLNPLVPLADSITLTEFQLEGFGSHPAAVAAAVARKIDPQRDITIEPNALAAVNQVLAKSAPNDLVLVTGSLYLCGAVRGRWIPEAEILRCRSIFGCG